MITLAVVVVFVFCCSSTCKGYPSKCKDDSFFDPTKEKYLPCSECNKKRQTLCYDCCPTSQKVDSDAIYLSEPQTTELVPSMKNAADGNKQHVVGLFFHIFIIFMVVCTLSVIACVGVKVAKERRTNECSAQDSRHSHNHDVAIIHEVWSMPQQSSLPKSPAPVNVVVNQLQETIPKQGGLDKVML